MFMLLHNLSERDFNLIQHFRAQPFLYCILGLLDNLFFNLLRKEKRIIFIVWIMSVRNLFKRLDDAFLLFFQQFQC